MIPTIFKSKSAIALLAAAVAAASGRFVSPVCAETPLGPAQLHIDIGPEPRPAPPPIAQPAPVMVERLSDQQLDHLLSPVALYPDPLVAVMLPAATYPDEIATAADWLRHHPSDDDAINYQPWESSIKALAHTPSVLDWMNANPDWTNTLGTAFAYQPQAVLDSIQRLRGMALAVGSLQNTAQQTVLIQDNRICIEPTAGVVEVPVYDWHAIYTRREEPTFFVGARLGGWFDHDLDWDRHNVVVGAHWDRGWDHRWDHDRDARPVILHGPGDHDRDRHEVRVGGTPWHRDDARPAPKFTDHTRDVIRSGKPDGLAPARPPERHDIREERRDRDSGSDHDRDRDRDRHDSAQANPDPGHSDANRNVIHTNSTPPNTTPPNTTPPRTTPPSATPPTATPPSDRGERHTPISAPPERSSEHNPPAVTPPADHGGEEHTSPAHRPPPTEHSGGMHNPPSTAPSDRGGEGHRV
jgi:hypothetical protein